MNLGTVFESVKNSFSFEIKFGDLIDFVLG